MEANNAPKESFKKKGAKRKEKERARSKAPPNQ